MIPLTVLSTQQKARKCLHQHALEVARPSQPHADYLLEQWTNRVRIRAEREEEETTSHKYRTIESADLPPIPLHAEYEDFPVDTHFPAVNSNEPSGDMNEGVPDLDHSALVTRNPDGEHMAPSIWRRVTANRGQTSGNLAGIVISLVGTATKSGASSSST